jgi:DNA-binding transcriptional ArsR family regulator
MATEAIDLTGFVDAPMRELAPVVEQIVAAGGASTDDLERAGALFFDRTLQLLREGTRSQMLEECTDLDRFLVSERGRLVQKEHPEVFGGWIALSELLGEAARRSDRAAVDAILRSNQGLGQRVLAMLAERGEPMPRGEMRKQLDISESHLSHLLRDLDEADLVIRYRQGKEVVVDLGPVGREVVQKSMAPAWVEAFVEHMEQLLDEDAERKDAETIAAELSGKGAPPLAARKLAAAATRTHRTISLTAAENIRRLVEEVSSEDPRYPNMQPDSGGPVSAFGVPNDLS